MLNLQINLFYCFLNPTIKNIFSQIDIAENCLVISHVNPDGDSIGATLALYLFLKKIKKNIIAIAPNSIPTFLKWMPFCNEIIVSENAFEEAKESINKADIIFCVDFNGLKRVEKLQSYLKESSAYKVLIDHHPEPELDSFQAIISNVNVSSTSELIFEFIKLSPYRELLNKDIAACIYTGIVTDTGSFSYSCRNASTFTAVAELINTGIDVVDIHKKIYSNYSLKRLKLLGFCIHERMVVIPDCNTAFIYLSKEDLNKYDYQYGDTEDVVNYPLSIENIYVSAFFTERDGIIRISMRSKGNFAVNNFVKNYFDGGGHLNAAGANSYINMKDTIDRFSNYIHEHKNDILYSVK